MPTFENEKKLVAQLLCALEEDREPEIGGRDNLKTMALVDACYLSAREHRAVELSEITGDDRR
jgi:predicted dehydrogenase